ncbi:MAG: hypothetical protein ACXAEX_10365 [Promethearchaeota archaeon]
MVKYKRYHSIALILFIIINTLFGIILIQINNSTLDFEEESKETILYSPKIANGPPLSYFAIDQNATTIYRLFESVNFTIDTFGFSDVDHTQMQIEFSNGSIQNFNMTHSVGNEYFYIYKPRYKAPLGYQNVSFLLYNNTGDLLNAHTTFRNFTTTTNYMAITSNSEYYVGDDLYAELTVNDFGVRQFNWNITLVNSTVELEQGNLINFEYNSVQFTYRITNETFYNFLGQTFYIKLNMTDFISGKTEAAYFPFKVLNTDPTIIGASINFTPSSVFRDEESTLTLNVTDIEDRPQDLVVTLSLEDPNGNIATTATIDHDVNDTFSGQFTVPAGSPKGKFRVEITAEDLKGGIGTFSTFLTVENNLPEIHSYTINGRSMNEEITVLYGDNLVFSFNVSDVERIDYIKVALIDENSDWYIITQDYIGIETRITIRTEELITGVWFVYIYVIDSDGEIISLIDDYDMAPQGITIVPDVLSTYMPWISFIFGIILGILAGIGLLFKHYKSKFILSQPTSPKKKDLPSEKPTTKRRQRREPVSDIVERIIEEPEPEEEKEEEKGLERKIKRKL